MSNSTKPKRRPSAVKTEQPQANGNGSEEGQKALADLSLSELKCLAFDEIALIDTYQVQISQHRMKLQALNQEIVRKQQQS